VKQLAILFLLLLTSPANGMIYSWTDSAGIAHYTNKEYEIPLRYRYKVKARYPEQGDSSTPPQNTHLPQVSPQKVQASQGERSVQAQPQTSVTNHPKPVQSSQSIIQQMREERAARKARRGRISEEE
jgi:hypothetical protein